MCSHIFFRVGLIAMLIVGTATIAIGKTLSSLPFSLGYGFTDITPGTDVPRDWTTNETASVNTPTTQGNFTFAPAPVSGGSFSGDGVGFVDRILEDRLGFSAHITPGFVFPVMASYTGAAPSDVAELPNYRLRIEITEVSIWAGAHPSSTTEPALNWLETTADHESESDSIVLDVSTDYNEVVGYKQLLWDPEDYEIPLTNLNDPFTRIFDLPADESGDPEVIDLRYADGLEVEGIVHLIYDAIPGAGVPGDYNENDVVDAADYVLWRKNPSSLANEGASIGIVDEEDYTFWRSQFGNSSTGSGALVAQGVPEPASHLLLLVALVAMVCFKPKRLKK